MLIEVNCDVVYFRHASQILLNSCVVTCFQCAEPVGLNQYTINNHSIAVKLSREENMQECERTIVCFLTAKPKPLWV